MATHDFPLHYPVDRVWAALPHAVQQVRSAAPGNPVPSGGYRFTFSTRMSMLTYGQQVFVDLYPQHPQHGPGTHMRVSTNLNFGLVDWGEGSRIATELHTAVMRVLAWWDNQPPHPGPPGPPSPPGPSSPSSPPPGPPGPYGPPPGHY